MYMLLLLQVSEYLTDCRRWDKYARPRWVIFPKKISMQDVSDSWYTPISFCTKFPTQWSGIPIIYWERWSRITASEADIVYLVKCFLYDITVAMNLGFQLVHRLSIMYIAPAQIFSTNPPCLGYYWTRCCSWRASFFFGPVIGIMTTLEEWVFARFMADNSHFHRDHRWDSDKELSRPREGRGHGYKPSQRSGRSHTLEVADYDEEEENLKPYGYGVLNSTRVFNSQADFETLLQHLHTAFKRMDEVRLNHTVGVPRCLFQLHTDKNGITAAPIQS